MNKIYYTKPSITDLEIRYVMDAATNGWGECCYDYITRAGIFKAHLGVKYAITYQVARGRCIWVWQL